jgi:hypothetical protein
MKSLQVKINFDRESSNAVSAVHLQSLPAHCVTKSIYLSFLIILIVASFDGCKESGKTSNPVAINFPVNQNIAADLIAKGVPADAAQFFAATKVETSSPNDTTLVCLQTFPNGATRNITIHVDPNRQYTPTADEIANTAHDNIPIYAFQFSSTTSPDSSTVTTSMSYYVAKAGLPKLFRNVQPFQHSANQSHSNALLRIASIADGNGAGISWLEVANKGQDVTISSVIDYASHHGYNTGPLGSIYQLASALSDVTTALEVSSQTTAWLNELKALKDCAANPTNQVARSDPNYSRDAVNKIESAENELKQASAVRFLNIMTETAAQLTPVTNVLSIGMKPGFSYSEQTLTDFSANTIMREARLAVVPCKDSTLDGNIDVVWECTSGIGGVDHVVKHTQTKVTWVYNPTNNLYYSQGSYIYDYTETITGGGHNGGTCTIKKTAQGNLGATGMLNVITDPAVRQTLGFGYSADGNLDVQAAYSNSCDGTTGMVTETVKWLPLIKAYTDSVGSYEGVMTNPSCGGSSSSGSETVKWSFSVPPP